MNYIYGEPKLNIKKVIIALSVLFFLLVLSIIFVHSHRNNAGSSFIKRDKTFLVDNNFNITIQKDLNLEQAISQNGFLLELHSESNFNFYISKIDGFNDEEFLKVAKSDYYYYPQNFENKFEISDLSEYSVNDFSGYTYNFKYIDSDSTFYLKIYILKINNNIYTFNVQIPVQASDIIEPNIEPIMNSININNSN